MTSPIGAIPPVAGPQPVANINAAGAASGASGTGASFGAQLAQGLNALQQLQSTSDSLSVKAATGTLSDPSQLMIATTQASLATELTTAVRDKAVDAFNEIMRMQA
jgi:flagellar hook-basal body complex protein FliE